MKKYLQSSWMRVLSQIICVLSVICIAIGATGFVFVTELDGVEGVYAEGYEDISENYSLYAIDMIQQGKEKELEKFFKNNLINATVTLYTAKEDGQENSYDSKTLFSVGTHSEDKTKTTLEMYTGSEYEYYSNSLLSMLFGYRYYYDEGNWVDYRVQQVVYDPGLGLFLHQTEIGYFKVPDIRLYVVGEEGYVDYSLTVKDGKECYYNGYFDITLDTRSCNDWEAVEIDNVLSRFQAFSAGNSVIYGPVLIVPDYWVPEEEIITTNYSLNYGSVTALVTDEVDYYQVEMSWDRAYGLSGCFSEWLEVCDMLAVLEPLFLPMAFVGVLLFIASFGMIIYSANKDKEKMGFMHKVPVFSYTFAVLMIEFAFAGLMALYVQMFIFDDKGKLGDAVAIFVLLAGIMAWLFFVWVQNIVTRVKCKSFWRTSELYYLYKWLKEGWKVIREKLSPVKKFFLEWRQMIRANTNLFVKGLLIFAAITLIELLVVSYFRWYGYGATLFVALLALKAIEGGVLVFALFQMKALQEGSKRVAMGDISTPIDTSKMFWHFKEHGENINKVSDGIQIAVNERMKSEHFKTELITNVSHDIKTPLTSIINYVDLIKKEEIADEKVQEYIEVLDRQSARLKKLIEDLMEASKASTGNLAVNLEEFDIDVLLTQILGEFEEKLQKNQLEVVVDKPEQPVKMMADGRHMWRVLDNLLNNACKYSMAGTRVYITLQQTKNETVIVFKNISKTALNIPSDELMERFVRGDSSRNTEGSGLGLSIAQSLTELMHGSMKLEIDGDLFKVILRFPIL